MGNKQLLSTMLHTLLSYADGVFEEIPVIDPRTGEALFTPPVLEQDHITQKEQALYETVVNELSEQRKCLVYLNYTNHRSVTSRLLAKFSEKKIKAEFLPSKIKPDQREKWITDALKRGTDVVIVNPECVKTGLDLLEFPTIIFFQTGYSVYTMRQASRRSFRLGQKKSVKVIFMTYKKTLQETALSLMGKKLEASLALEGKFSEEGLMAMTSGEDMSTALARALVSGLDDSEGIESTWRSINAKQKGGAVCVDGEIHDVDLLLKMGWPREQAEAYLSSFSNDQLRRETLARLIRAYQASSRVA
jgi:hypothetical protein